MFHVMRFVLVLAALFAAVPSRADDPTPVSPPAVSVEAVSPVSEPVFADDFAPEGAKTPIVDPVDRPATEEPTSSPPEMNTTANTRASTAEASTTKASGVADYYGADYYAVPAALAPPAPSPARMKMSPDLSGGGCTPAAGDQGGDHVLRMAVGDIVSDRLAAWLRGYGYVLTWEAAVYRAEGVLVLDKGFDGTLRAIKDALEAHGTKLDVTVYENCTVRIVRAK